MACNTVVKCHALSTAYQGPYCLHDMKSAVCGVCVHAVCVCVCVCVSVWGGGCLCVGVWVGGCGCGCLCVCGGGGCLCVCVCVCVCVYVCVWVGGWVSVGVWMCLCVCVCACLCLCPVLKCAITYEHIWAVSQSTVHLPGRIALHHLPSHAPPHTGTAPDC